MKIGIICGFSRFWIGYHWSSYNKRLCINIVPFITIWVVFPGGTVPYNN